MNQHAWLKDAACQGHESLHPDAWYALNQYGLPTDLGLQALGVCLTQCPVKDQCRDYMAETEPRATIAGGGWWDNRGVFRTELPENVIDSYQLATMLGVSYSLVHQLSKTGVIPSAGRAVNGKHCYRMSDVRARTAEIAKALKGLDSWEIVRKREAKARAAKKAASSASSSSSSSARAEVSRTAS